MPQNAKMPLGAFALYCLLLPPSGQSFRKLFLLPPSVWVFSKQTLLPPSGEVSATPTIGDKKHVILSAAKYPTEPS